MFRRHLLLSCIFLACTVFAFAQNVNIGAKGTDQVPGAAGVLKKAYSLGNIGAQLNFTLLDAVYRADQLRFEDSVYYPVAGEKLLVVHYVIHNPEKVDQKVLWSAFDFLAVDSTETTCEVIKNAIQANTGEKLDIILKPGQKIEAISALRVAAAGEVPKLIVQRHAPPVLRYNLLGKVSPLPAPYSDPADKTGATLRDEVPAELQTAYATGIFQTSIQSINYTSEPLAGNKPKDGKYFAVVTVSATNMNSKEEPLFWSVFKPKLLLPEDEEARYIKEVFHATRDEKISLKVLPGKTAIVRWCFECPLDLTAQKLIVQEKAYTGNKEGRRFVYTLTNPAPEPDNQTINP